jgi:large subunit ribosomal protein L13
MVLRGKNKGQYTPHVDTGDFVIVVNAEKIRLTGQKLSQKFYYRHTGFPGGIYSVVAGKLMATHPERLLRTAVSGMLPRTPMGRKVLGKLKVYAGTEHPHKAQKPEKIEF